MHHARLSLALLLSLASPTLAQRAGELRSGFYASFGVGYGIVSLTPCDGCGASSQAGYSGYLALGGTLSPHWRLGFEASLWQQPNSTGDARLNFFSAAAALYPSETSPFWIKGNLGYSYISTGFFGTAVLPSGQPWSSPGGGVTVGIGAGYDWDRAFGDVAVLPYVDLVKQITPWQTGLPLVFELGVGIGIRH
jgi:hypothetical protein